MQDLLGALGHSSALYSQGTALLPCNVVLRATILTVPESSVLLDGLIDWSVHDLVDLWRYPCCQHESIYRADTLYMSAKDIHTSLPVSAFIQITCLELSSFKKATNNPIENLVTHLLFEPHLHECTSTTSRKPSINSTHPHTHSFYCVLHFCRPLAVTD